MNLDEVMNIEERLKDMIEDKEDEHNDIMSTVRYCESVGAYNTAKSLQEMAIKVSVDKINLEHIKKRFEAEEHRIRSSNIGWLKSIVSEKSGAREGKAKYGNLILKYSARY